MWQRRKALYIYYRRTGFYTFLLQNTLKALMIITILVAGLVLLKSLMPDTMWSKLELDGVPPAAMFAIFFVSETVLGILPPDFFILWIQQFNSFWLLIGLLGILSYLGGMVAFSVGRVLRRNTRLNEFIQIKFHKYIPYINKWGGFFIVIAAITPLPFSPICLLGGTLNYPLKKYAMYAATRVIRFAIYGFIFMKVLI